MIILVYAGLMLSDFVLLCLFVGRNKNAMQMQFDLSGKMHYYIPRFFETRSRDLLAQS